MTSLLRQILARAFVQSDNTAPVPAGGDNHLVPVNQRAFAVSPRRYATAEFGDQVSGPDRVAIFCAQTGDIAATTLNIQKLSINRWGPPRTVALANCTAISSRLLSV